MDESPRDRQVTGMDFMKERVHHVVAHISSCRVGDKSRNMVCFQSRNNVLDRKGGKVGRRAAGNDGLVLGLIPVIVRDGSISEIDRDPLDSKAGIASGLTHANDSIRLAGIDGLL